MSINLKENNIMEVLSYFNFTVNKEKVSFNKKELSSEQLEKLERTAKLLTMKVPFLYILGNGEIKSRTADTFKIFKCIKEDTHANNDDILNIIYYIATAIETADKDLFEKVKRFLNKIYDTKHRTDYKFYKYIWNFYNMKEFYLKDTDKQFTLSFFN